MLPRVAPIALVLLATALGAGTALAAPTGTAPGAPGDETFWNEADKDGYGTSAGTESRVWHTLDDGVLTEVFYPDLGTPAVRDLQLVVSDGRTFAERERDATTQTIELADPESLTYRQVNTDRDGQYRITKTYVTDPARNTLLIDIHFESLSGKPYRVHVLHDPALSNTPMDDTGRSLPGALLADDASSGSALVGSPEFNRTSSGFAGESDGWEDLRSDFRMDWAYRSAPEGNVVQTARTQLTGKPDAAHMTLALGFGDDSAEALEAARASLAGGFDAAASAYASGWHDHLDDIGPGPESTGGDGGLYDVSMMTLAAHEDKTFRGAYIASPSMPWVWGQGLEDPSAAYHLVWSRDLYQIATALIAGGDRAGAERALAYLFEVQQKPDGSFPQNSTVDGTEKWTNLQLDEVALPIVLAWQLGPEQAAESYSAEIKKAADFIVNFPDAPFTPQERWENQSGYSPGTIAAEIAGLVCAAAILADSDPAAAERYLEVADAWQEQVEGWTATTTGPYSDQPYYLRLTKDGNPDAGTTYNIGDSGPENVDQRKVVDPSFLELVRLGVKPYDDPIVENTLGVVDEQLASGHPSGELFWHRFNFDGYGEQKDGSPWDIGFDPNPTEIWANNVTIGRNWPIFGGERGEYELLAGDADSARARLGHIARAANEGLMLPEQVWADDFPPGGEPGFPLGEGTFSATPLAWTHAQYVRLAWSIDAGRPVEQPSVVACRYVGC